MPFYIRNLDIQGFWCLQAGPWNHSWVDTKGRWSSIHFTMLHSSEDNEADRHLSEQKDGIMERDLETMLF